MNLPNPFTPNFGKIPPHLAGRKNLLEDMRRALANGPGDPNLSSILIGARGTGKTALLSRFAQDAAQHGWVTASVSATPGMLEDIIERAAESASEIIDAESGVRIRGLSIGQLFGVELDREAQAPGNWRTRMNALFKQLDTYGTGLLITVDEVHVELDEMIQLASVYQHFVREDRRVALVMAGLPSNVSDLVDNKSVSFLRRARQHHLSRIGDADIASAFRKTVEGGGGTIDEDALAAAVTAIDGFPYMMQLVGYWAWEECPSTAIHAADVKRGVGLAAQEFRTGVLSATFRELSKGDLRFIEAMLPDGQESSLADIAQRMGVKSNYASKYKRRLLEAGVIGDRGHGYYSIDLPGFGAYVQERIGERDGSLE